MKIQEILNNKAIRKMTVRQYLKTHYKPKHIQITNN